MGVMSRGIWSCGCSNPLGGGSRGFPPRNSNSHGNEQMKPHRPFLKAQEPMAPKQERRSSAAARGVRGAGAPRVPQTPAVSPRGVPQRQLPLTGLRAQALPGGSVPSCGTSPRCRHGRRLLCPSRAAGQQQLPATENEGRSQTEVPGRKEKLLGFI